MPSDDKDNIIPAMHVTEKSNLDCGINDKLLSSLIFK